MTRDVIEKALVAGLTVESAANETVGPYDPAA